MFQLCDLPSTDLVNDPRPVPVHSHQGIEAEVASLLLYELGCCKRKEKRNNAKWESYDQHHFDHRHIDVFYYHRYWSKVDFTTHFILKVLHCETENDRRTGREYTKVVALI